MTERIESLDSLKGLALFFVVFLHARGPFINSASSSNFLEIFIISFSRFAVPVFFLSSGYLFKMKLEEKNKWSYTKGYLKNLLYYYCGASAFYLILIAISRVMNSFIGLNIATKFLIIPQLSGETIFKFLYLGFPIARHLWFLPALFYSIALIYIFEKSEKIRELIVLSVILHLIGIILNSYGLVENSVVPRTDAMMFGLLFTSLGFRIRGSDREFNSEKIFLVGTFIFSVLHFFERIFIVSSVEHMTIYYGGDYSLFTAPMAICFFLYALSKKDWAENSALNTYGKNTLWGYLLHPMFVGLFIGISSLIGSTINYALRSDLGWSITISIFSYILMMEIINRGRKSGLR